MRRDRSRRGRHQLDQVQLVDQIQLDQVQFERQPWLARLALDLVATCATIAAGVARDQLDQIQLAGLVLDPVATCAAITAGVGVTSSTRCSSCASPGSHAWRSTWWPRAPRWRLALARDQMQHVDQPRFVGLATPWPGCGGAHSAPVVTMSDGRCCIEIRKNNVRFADILCLIT